MKWQHTHPHLKQFIAVDSFEISIYINLKVTVDRHSNIHIYMPKNDSDSVKKPIFELILRKLKFLINLQHPYRNEIYQYA